MDGFDTTRAEEGKVLEAFDRRRTVMWVVGLAMLGALGWIMSATNLAGASSGGISGYSGNPATGGGATCSQCHSGGVKPTVTLDGPTTVAPGQTASYTLTIVGGTGGGFDVSVTGGTLVAGADSKVSGGEVVHTGTKPTSGGEVAWTFSWTAPASAGDVTMYGAGNAVNGDFGLGGDAVETDTLAIAVEAENAPPVADTGGPYVGDPTDFIVFDGSGSSDSDGTIVSWDWDFGDGSAASGKSLFHSYPEAGVYTVKLEVTDNAGATHTATTSATIGEVSNLPPTADAGGPYTGTAGKAIAFNGSGSSDPEGSTLTYAWDFGDGNTSTRRRPSHTYSAAGSFTVTLTVTDDTALSGSDTAQATVAAAPTTTTTTTSTAAPSVAAIYSSKCAGCHGANGQGGAGPSLQTSSLSTSAIQSIIANGATGMPGSSGSLSSSELSGLATFTKALQTPGATTTEAPTSGSAIYSSKCAGCHGAGGQGGSGPSLQTSTLTSAQVRSIVASGAAGMPGYSSSLASDQISAVSSYAVGLQDSEATTTTLDPSSGGSAAYASQCAGCHGANGEGGLGPSLQASVMPTTEIESVISGGLGTMPGFSTSLTSEQITELAAFTASFQGGAPPGEGGDGSLLYATHCAACHGTAGEGGIGPALAGTALTAADMTSVMQTGRGVMPSFTSVLSSEEVETVVGFILTLEDTPDDPAVTDVTAQLYQTLCSGCHGSGGEGASGPALVGTQLDSAGLIAIIADGAGGMPGYGSQLSSTEIEDLAVLIMAMGQGHQEPGDTTTTSGAAVTTTRPEASDDPDQGVAARTLGIILLAFVLGSGTYLAFASRATRQRR